MFNKLPQNIIYDIVGLRLKELQQRLNPRRVALDVSDEARAWLAEQGYSEHFGARAVARVVKDKIITPIAKKSLTGEIKDGQVVRIELVDGAISLTSHSPAGAVEPVAEEGERTSRPEARTLEVLDDEDMDEVDVIEPDEIRRPAV